MSNHRNNVDALRQQMAHMDGERPAPLPDELYGALKDAAAAPGPVTLGTTKFVDDTGLSWIMVVAATEHGDCPVAVYPDRAHGLPQAAGHVAQLLDMFEILGIAAERGEVQSP